MTRPPFHQLLRQHGPGVHRYLRAAVGSEAADDCYQETWLAALRGYPQLRRADNLAGWVYTIARTKAADHGRRRARSPVPVGAAPAGVGPAPGPERAAVDGDLWVAVDDLPDGQRDAVRLRYGADLAYADVGRVLGCSEAAARQRVRAGLSRLRQEVQR